MTPVLLFACFGVDSAAWLQALAAQLPDVRLRAWPDVGDAAEIDYVLAWNAPPEVWIGLSGLKAVFSMGAGVDKLLADPAIPQDIPLVRMVDPSLVLGMIEYVTLSVLTYHRQMPHYRGAQAEHAWKPERPPLPDQRKVGIMGLGQLGGACARALAAQGFDVTGWSRSPSAIGGVRNIVGWDELASFAAEAEILVCLLPLTPETEGVLKAALFEAMPKGAYLINVARGQHLVEEDLLAALESGQLTGATLDVFRTEPLPRQHPFWSHPAITITPHISAVTQPRTAARSLADNLTAHLAGAPFNHVVDRRRGY